MKLGVEGKARLLFAALVVILALGWAGWYFADALDYKTYRIETHDAVSGLIAKSPVEYHGVEVGEVTKVDLVDPRTVRVTLRVRSGAPVTRATVATITSRGVATRGFTGYVTIALEDASDDRSPLVAAAGEPYPRIPTAASKSATMDVAIAEVQRDVRELTVLLKGVLDRDTVTALRDSLAALQRISGTLQEVLDKKTVAQLKDSLAAVQRVSATVERTLDARTVASLKESLENLRVVTKTLADNNERMERLIKTGDEVSGKLAPLLDSSQQTVKALQTQVLPQAQRTLESVESLTHSLSGFAAKVERNPSVILRGQAPARPGPGEEP
jgi:phospholipid/cholesterol/gamma-HCH transport system substrate-binding protein